MRLSVPILILAVAVLIVAAPAHADPNNCEGTSDNRCFWSTPDGQTWCHVYADLGPVGEICYGTSTHL